MRLTKPHSGFTLVETLFAMSVISIIAVASVYSLFLSLNLRDLTLSSSKVEESLRIFDYTFRRAVIGANTISGSGNSVFLRSATVCSSFVYDAILKNLKYARIEQSGCVPDPDPQSLFFPTEMDLNSFTFVIHDIQTGGRQVSLNGQIQSVLPFDTYIKDFSNTYINLVD